MHILPWHWPAGKKLLMSIGGFSLKWWVVGSWEDSRTRPLPLGKPKFQFFFFCNFCCRDLLSDFSGLRCRESSQVCCRWQWNYQQSQVCWYTNTLLGRCQNLNHIPELTDSERCWQSVRSTERKAWWGTSLPPSSKGSSARRRWESWWWGWTLLARPQSSTNLSLGRLWRPSLP